MNEDKYKIFTNSCKDYYELNSMIIKNILLNYKDNILDWKKNINPKLLKNYLNFDDLATRINNVSNNLSDSLDDTNEKKYKTAGSVNRIIIESIIDYLFEQELENKYKFTNEGKKIDQLGNKIYCLYENKVIENKYRILIDLIRIYCNVFHHSEQLTKPDYSDIINLSYALVITIYWFFEESCMGENSDSLLSMKNSLDDGIEKILQNDKIIIGRIKILLENIHNIYNTIHIKINPEKYEIICSEIQKLKDTFILIEKKYTDKDLNNDLIGYIESASKNIFSLLKYYIGDEFGVVSLNLKGPDVPKFKAQILASGNTKMIEFIEINYDRFISIKNINKKIKHQNLSGIPIIMCHLLIDIFLYFQELILKTEKECLELDGTIFEETKLLFEDKKKEFEKRIATTIEINSDLVQQKKEEPVSIEATSDIMSGNDDGNEIKDDTKPERGTKSKSINLFLIFGLFVSVVIIIVGISNLKGEPIINPFFLFGNPIMNEPVCNENQIKLSWQNEKNANYYEIEINTYPRIKGYIKDTSLVFKNTYPQGSYLWKIRSHFNGKIWSNMDFGYSKWSEGIFHIKYDSIKQIESIDLDTINFNQATLHWKNDKRADGYSLSIKKSNKIILDTIVLATNYSLNNYERGVKYYITVSGNNRSRNIHGIRNTFIKIIPERTVYKPLTIELLNEVYIKGILGERPHIEWKKLDNIKKYLIEIKRGNKIQHRPIDHNYYDLDLKNAGIYEVRVQAISNLKENPAPWSSWIKISVNRANN